MAPVTGNSQFPPHRPVWCDVNAGEMAVFEAVLLSVSTILLIILFLKLLVYRRLAN